ncbi:MAG: hypothetical protein R3D02_02800 [Hyphomicrobiales bacterium]
MTRPNPDTDLLDPTQWHPHSMPLQLWVNFGLIGAVVFSGALLMVLRRIGRIEPGHQAGALALYAGLFAVAGVSHGAWQEWWMVLVGFALVEAIRRSGPIPAKAP